VKGVDLISKTCKFLRKVCLLHVDEHVFDDFELELSFFAAVSFFEDNRFKLLNSFGVLDLMNLLL